MNRSNRNGTTRGGWCGFVAWGKRLLQRWRGEPTEQHDDVCVETLQELVRRRMPAAATWTQDEALGVVGDSVEFVGGPLDGLTHTLWNCYSMAPRMAIPISEATFEAVEDPFLDKPHDWSSSGSGVTSIAIYVLYPSPSGWRYHYELSGAAR